MIPQERGLEGITVYFIFYLPIIFLIYMSFLGKAMWLLIFKDINPYCWFLGGFIFTHCSLFIVHTCHFVLTSFTLAHTLHYSFILILARER
jgi:hypothetical protein